MKNTVKKKKKKSVRKKNLKIALICAAAAAVLALVVVLELMLVPPRVGQICHTSVEKYGKWNAGISALMDERFHGLLPSEEIAEKFGTEYRYEYSCSFLGDPVFILTLKCSFGDDAAFDAEESRIADSIKLLKEEDGIRYYVRPDYEKNLSLYLDSQVKDGLCLAFENVCFCEAERTAEWHAAVIWDSEDLPENFDEISSWNILPLHGEKQ